jgi:small subunit ribosomal protein S6
MSQEQAKEYEILYFISINLDENEIKTVKDKINDILNKHQATITKEENMGKHKLAYMIKRARHGYFLLVTFTAATTAIAAIDHEIKLMPEILRYKLAIKQKNTTAAVQSKLEQKIPSIVDPVIENKKNLAPEKKVTTTKEETNVKVDTQELDRKLDELLADDV